MSAVPPVPQGRTAVRALEAILRGRTVFGAMEAIHRELGDVFRLPLPGFDPIVLVGPEANRFVLMEGRDQFRWRSDSDPVTRLLREGLLVVDGEAHDQVHELMSPYLRRDRFAGYVESMVAAVDSVADSWSASRPIDLLDDMRRIALLILVRTLFGADLRPDLDRIWTPMLKTLGYISPGAWLVWPGAPRLGYRGAMTAMDDYLYSLIRARRAKPDSPDDMLGALVRAPGLSDGFIRDQLLTMLIAGHDTSTALQTWGLYLLARHPDVLRETQAEADHMLNGSEPALESLSSLKRLENAVFETLRLYPPIHLGSRIALRDLAFQGFQIPAGARVVYSIYLSHRHPDHWDEPGAYRPERFDRSVARRPPPYLFVPFGGGPRNCIGGAFGLVEAKVVLARLLQRFDFELLTRTVRPRLAATLEPTRILMRVTDRVRERDLQKAT